MTNHEAIHILKEQVSPTGIKNYIELISAISQELGLLLAFGIDPENTARIRAMAGTLDQDNYNTAVEIYLNDQMQLKDDIQELERELHKAIGNFFVKHKAGYHDVFLLRSKQKEIV